MLQPVRFLQMLVMGITLPLTTTCAIEDLKETRRIPSPDSTLEMVSLRQPGLLSDTISLALVPAGGEPKQRDYVFSAVDPNGQSLYWRNDHYFEILFGSGEIVHYRNVWVPQGSNEIADRVEVHLTFRRESSLPGAEPTVEQLIQDAERSGCSDWVKTIVAAAEENGLCMIPYGQTIVFSNQECAGVLFRIFIPEVGGMLKIRANTGTVAEACSITRAEAVSVLGFDGQVEADEEIVTRFVRGLRRLWKKPVSSTSVRPGSARNVDRYPTKPEGF